MWHRCKWNIIIVSIHQQRSMCTDTHTHIRTHLFQSEGNSSCKSILISSNTFWALSNSSSAWNTHTHTQVCLMYDRLWHVIYTHITSPPSCDYTSTLFGYSCVAAVIVILSIQHAEKKKNHVWRPCEIIVYLAPGQTALGNVVCRQDTLSPAWSGSLQQRGGLQEREQVHVVKALKSCWYTWWNIHVCVMQRTTAQAPSFTVFDLPW